MKNVKRATVAVIFVDGHVEQAETWLKLEKKLLNDEWNPSTRVELREEFARRAWTWSESPVDTEHGARAFFDSLENAGMLRTIEGREQESV